MEKHSKKKINEIIRERNINAEIRGDFSDVSSIINHSKNAVYGALFVCLRGAEHNGHDYASVAYARGCRHFLCDAPLSLPEDAAILQVKSVRSILCDLLFDFYGVCREDFVFAAVTGTKGKTTTAVVLMRIMNQAGYPTACSSTLGLFDGTTTKQTQNTTPDLFTLVPWFAELRNKKIRYVVIEASSAALSGGRLIGMNFSVGILTSFSRDHVGKGEHKNMAEYLCAKRSLFSNYGVKTAILPSGIYRGEYIVSDVEKVVLLPSDNEIISEVEERKNAQAFLYHGKRIVMSLIGEHNRTNARLALKCASLLTGKEEKYFYSYLSNVFVSGRYEQIQHKGVNVVIDYAHNRESFEAVAKAASGRSHGRLICVFGSVGERGFERRKELAEVAETRMDLCVITEDNPESESGFGICSEIYAEFSDKTKAKIVSDRADAIRYAFSLCREGDHLLLLGKGHETVQRKNGKCMPFSEKDILLSL